MDENLLRDRIFDTAQICERTNRPKFLGFLSLEQARLAQNLLQSTDTDFSFFGGYQGAQRVFLGCFPSWDSEHSFPVTAITARFRTADTVTHRDVLGSLMGLGLKRETVGDILVETGRAVIFVQSENANYIIAQLNKIGRVGVTLETGFEAPLPQGSELRDFSVTVASSRLDCVVGAVAGVSRSSAAEMIEQGLVSVNSVVTEKITANISNEDVISVRGKGRFIISSLDGITRKNRRVLNYKKFV